MSETQPAPLVLSVIVTEHGVNMGDHGQDMLRAVAVTPDTTIGALMESVARKKYVDEGWREDVSVTIRAASLLPSSTNNDDPWS